MPRIKDLPKHEMPREKLIEKGAISLKDKELLAILLRTGIEGKNVIEMSDGILKKYSMKKLVSLDFKTLSKVKGIGPATTLVASWKYPDIGYIEASAKQVEQINYRVIRATKIIFANNKKYLEYILERDK
jgi:DNA repair protein RadC